MNGIDQASFQFNEKAALVVALMVTFLVFAVSLDLTMEQFRRVAKQPKAALVGLIGQFVILPALAFLVGRYLIETPSVALGLLLVACCPGGALSNYLTGLAKGDVALSVSISAISMVIAVVATPAVFAFWAAMNPDIKELLRDIKIDPKTVVIGFVVMLALPVAAGMWIRAKRAQAADKMRKPVRIAAAVVFAVVVAMVLGANMKLLVKFAAEALVPVVLTFAGAMVVGWALGWASRVGAADRRAIAIEVGVQNVALAIAISIAFFPGVTGAAVTAAMWGAVHVVGGLALAGAWSRVPTD